MISIAFRIRQVPHNNVGPTKRRCICFASITLILLLMNGGNAAERRPNVLFLAVDDMKDWVGCLGGYAGTVHTPHIDRLAESGLLFTNAHCISPKCAPSRAALLTGKRPSTTGLYDNGHWWLPNHPDIVTIPAHFRAHGYRVVGAGKIFHHTAGNNPPNQWDEFLRFTFKNDPWFRSSKLNYPWSSSSPNPPHFPFSGVDGLGHENDWGALPISEADYDDAQSTNYAIAHLENTTDAGPFFLACGIFRPHLPWYVPQRFFDLYPLEDVRLPAVQASDLDDVPAAGKKFALARQQDFLRIKEADHWRHAVRAYLASISYADHQLGRVLDALAQSRHADNTIVVLWSDHGWHLGEKGHWHKSTLWEEATRIPFIVRVPSMPSGKCNAPVSLLNVFPTLIELCRLADVEGLEGVSLLPLLRNPKSTWNRPAVTQYQKGNAAVRSHRFRYIRYADGSEELYDVKSDPHEWLNLANDPEYRDFKRELATWLPQDWAESALTKKAFSFDPETYSWTNKLSRKITNGKN